MSHVDHSNICSLRQKINLLVTVLPDALAHKAVWILSSEGGEQRSCRKTLLQFDGLGVGTELWTLVDVQDSYRDSHGGLARQMNSTSKRDLILGLHHQHEGPFLLIVDRLHRRYEEGDCGCQV